jgi:hypothetical protein
MHETWHFWNNVTNSVFHLKRNLNYNSDCQHWWHQYNKTNELFFSFYLLWRTYRKALQQMSTTFSKSHKLFQCPEILLLVGFFFCLILYFLFRIRVAKCFTNSSKPFRWEAAVREWACVLFVNTPCSHLHSFCATGVRSGLAIKGTLTRVSRRRLGESISRGWTCFWFQFCAAVRDCCWVAF